MSLLNHDNMGEIIFIINVIKVYIHCCVVKKECSTVPAKRQMDTDWNL